MKKKLLYVTALLLLAVGAAVTWQYTRPDPPLETKFVQNVEPIPEEENSDSEFRSAVEIQEGESASEKNSTLPKVTLKEPSDYANLNVSHHVYQTFNNCGPATLSMIMSFYNVNVSQDTLAERMRPYQNPQGDNDDKTIFTSEFVDWANEYNLEAVGRVNGNIDLLKKFTANGIPVVVKTWLNNKEDIGHFRLVRGFDEKKQVVIQNDSYYGPNKATSYYDFLSAWQPFNYDYIVVYTKDMEDTVEAIIGDEMDRNVSWERSLLRAEKERELNPSGIYTSFNISTAAYHLGDYERSVKEFEAVESKLPRRMLWYQLEPVLAYKELGKTDRVFSITNNILDNGNRAYSELYFIRGQIYLEEGSEETAKSEFEKALRYNKYYLEAKEALDSLES